MPELGRTVEEIGLEPSMVLVFTGQVDGKVQPQEVVAEAWDFSAINRGYAAYMDFAKRVVKGMGRSGPAPALLKSTLADDRRKWWKAVRRDPLLPQALLPKGYKGVAAWTKRQEMHAKLFRTIDFTLLNGKTGSSPYIRATAPACHDGTCRSPRSLCRGPA